MLATADVRRDRRKLRLAGIFYVACNAKIKELSLGIECSIIMPANVSVSVEILADYCPDEVGISILVDDRRWARKTWPRESRDYPS